MRFIPLISGVWYGLPVDRGVPFAPPERLAAKCLAQPENFTPEASDDDAPAEAPKRRGRPRKAA